MLNAGQKFSFGVTFDSPDLFVAAKIYDNSGASPVLLATVPMLNFYGNSYQGSFTQVTPTTLLIQYSCYTDDTYTAINNNEPQGDREEQIVQGAGGGGSGSGCELIRLICNEELLGFICDETITGLIEC